MLTDSATHLPEIDASGVEPPPPQTRAAVDDASGDDRLFALAFNDRSPVAHRLEVASYLAAAGRARRRAEEIAPYLESRSARDRQVAALALGSPGNLQAIFLLIGLLDDPAISVRRAAVRGLAGIGDPRVLGFLLSAIDRDDRLVTVVLSALKRFPLELTRSAFERFLSAADPETAILALGAFAYAPPEVAAPVAAPFLSHADARLRSLAISLIGRSRDRAYLEPLFPLLGDADARVREVTRDAIAALRA